MNFSRYFLLGISLAVGVRSAEALNKPTQVAAFYNAAHDQLVVKWDKVANAERYRILVKDSSGRKAARGFSDDLLKRFPGSRFERFKNYRVQVQSVAGSSQSRAASKAYTHILSRGAGKGTLLSKNASGRSGAYYLPRDFENKSRPLLVGFHGQGAGGDSIIGAFTSYAEKHDFIIVAPSSNLFSDGTAAWEIEQGGAPTPDFNHIRNCIDEVRAFVNVSINPARVLALGYSAGAAVAPYFATSAANSEFTHFGVLHGGVVFDTLGPRTFPGWLSTGTSDPLRPPSELQGYKTELQALGFNVIYTEYETDHALAKEERRDVIEWWLDK